MNKRDLLRGLRATQTPERKRATAYHEAGHAAMQFMFCNHPNIEYIDMRGNLNAAGCVWSRPFGLLNWIPEVPGSGHPRALSLFHGKQLMMFYLAGYAAEHRLAPASSWHWLDEQMDMADCRWNRTDPRGRHDLSIAIELAKALHGTHGNAWRFLRQMAAWTDEALSHPRLWGVVVALAEQLATAKKIGGNRVCRIMDGAWKEACLPYMEMGPKWRRRFSISRPTAETENPR